MAPTYLLRIVMASAAIAGAGGAEAAVKVCQAPQSSGIIVAPTETEGKRKAIEAWTLKVRVAGGAKFAGWPVAASKTLKCAPMKDGRVACIAIGTPCVIQQAPPRNDKRKPLGGNKPIEA